MLELYFIGYGDEESFYAEEEPYFSYSAAEEYAAEQELFTAMEIDPDSLIRRGKI